VVVVVVVVVAVVVVVVLRLANHLGRTLNAKINKVYRGVVEKLESAFLVSSKISNMIKVPTARAPPNARPSATPRAPVGNGARSVYGTLIEH